MAWPNVKPEIAGRGTTAPNTVEPTWRSAFTHLRDAFRDAEFATPDLDATILLTHITGVSRAQLIAAPDTRLTPLQKQHLSDVTQRRLNHEPVSRIIGSREFYGRLFEISSATLDPRPETETLVDQVLHYVSAHDLQNAPLRILDVGTGTGALALTLLCELPQARAVATDICPDALAVAARNAQRLGVVDRVTFCQTRGLETLTGPYDIFVSNPPYIAEWEIAGLAPEVRNFDPYMALSGGPDGLDFYHLFAARIAEMVPDGLAVFEVGHQQSKQVVNIFQAKLSNLDDAAITVAKDLSGTARCVAVQTHS